MIYTGASRFSLCSKRVSPAGKNAMSTWKFQGVAGPGEKPPLFSNPEALLFSGSKAVLQRILELKETLEVT